MRNTRIFIAVVLALLLATTVIADGRRRAVAGGPSASDYTVDALSLGKVNGATISGSVQSVAGTVVTLNTGAAQQIRIDVANAKIFGAKEVQKSVADIVPGVRITAFVTPSMLTVVGAPLIAQVVTVESMPDLAIAGPVESIDVAASKFTVLGITIYVDASTSFGSAMPTFAPIKGLADIAVGSVVTTDVSISGAKLLARRVMVAAPAIESISVRGKVKSISATSWVITEKDGKDVTVTVNDKTKISGNPVVGDEVQIVVTRDSSSALVALLIVKLDFSAVKEIELAGYVKSIAADKWTIGGPAGSMMPEFTIRITPSTTIYADPKVGDRVVIYGTREASGVFTATKIKKIV